MTEEEIRRLREGRRRMLRLLLDVDEWEDAGRADQRRMVAARLREVARLCIAQCYYLEEKEKEKIDAT